jgi:hypothetical protein
LAGYPISSLKGWNKKAQGNALVSEQSKATKP